MAFSGLFQQGAFRFETYRMNDRRVHRIMKEGSYSGADKAPEFPDVGVIGRSDILIKYWDLTTIEDLRRLPMEVREVFLPILLNGGNIYVHRDGGRITPLNPHEWGDFWFLVKFFMAS